MKLQLHNGDHVDVKFWSYFKMHLLADISLIGLIFLLMIIIGSLLA